MSNIEKIRQEIDTRRQHMVEELMGHEENCEYHRIKGMHDAYVDLLTFLDYSLPEEKPLTVEDIKTILDISFWNDDPQKILDEYNRICDTSKVTPR